MARESVEQRRARLMPGAQWLRSQRESRGWSGTELARRVSEHQDAPVGQERISAYERAQDEPPTEFARSLARAFGVSEVAVWRGLQKPLPAELDTDAAAVEWAWRTHPDVMEKVTGRKSPYPRTQPEGKSARVTRESDKPFRSSPDEESAV